MEMILVHLHSLSPLLIFFLFIIGEFYETFNLYLFIFCNFYLVLMGDSDLLFSLEDKDL
jgi:hypothetical protein